MNEIRFAATGKVRVWVTSDDILIDRRAIDICLGKDNDDEKVKMLKELAKEIAREKFSYDHTVGADVDLDSFEEDGLDRIDWYELLREINERMSPSMGDPYEHPS